MLAVLRGELAATSFGGEVYLAALFLTAPSNAYPERPIQIHQVPGFDSGSISAKDREGYFVADLA